MLPTLTDDEVNLLLPMPGNPVTCGNRTDLPKKQRRHYKVSLGMDTRNFGTKGFCDVEVFFCLRCGRDFKGHSTERTLNI